MTCSASLAEYEYIHAPSVDTGFSLNAWLFGAGFDIDLDSEISYSVPFTTENNRIYGVSLDLTLLLGGMSQVHAFVGPFKLTVFFEIDIGKLTLPLGVTLDLLTLNDVCLKMLYQVESFTLSVAGEAEVNECELGIVGMFFLSGVSCQVQEYQFDIYSKKFLGEIAPNTVVSGDILAANGLPTCFSL